MRQFTKYPSSYVKASTEARNWRINPIGGDEYEAYSDCSSSSGLVRCTNEVVVTFRAIGDDVQYVSAYEVGPGGFSDYTGEAELLRFHPGAMNEIRDQFFTEFGV